MERVKINQERLVRNYKISQAKFGTLSLMLMVAYALSVEFYLFQSFAASLFSSKSPQIAPELEDRKFLYITPCLLWLVNTLTTSWHLRQVVLSCFGFLLPYSSPSKQFPKSNKVCNKFIMLI